MILLIINILVFTVICNSSEIIDTDDQLPLYKKRTGGHVGVLTTSAGEPVYHNEAVSINTNVIFNEFFMESFLHFDRERIPPRVVHEKGAGARGYLMVSNDVTHICNAKLFNQIGKKTDVLVRFSPVSVETGGQDTSRDVRGLAVKFYTEDGNLDLLMLNVEMFFLKDPLHFIPYSHAFKRNPQTFLHDPNARWDFITSNPESMFMFMRFFGDRGIPDGYRFLPGHAIHPFQVVNKKGEVSFVKFNLRPKKLRDLTSESARKIQCEDLDYANRDLYNAIANGDYPSWALYMEVLTLEEVMNAKYDVFDITKVWPDDVPQIEIGALVLDKNPVNYFAEVEQVAFNPSNLVPGILGGVDTVFQARRFAYADTQNYRLGSNLNNIRVNCPLNNVHNYNRGGVAPVKGNGENAPNYYPNSFNGPEPVKENKPKLWNVHVDPEPNNFEQARNLYEVNMTESERERLTENIANSLTGVVTFIRTRAIELLNRIHPDLASRVSIKLKSE